MRIMDLIKSLGDFVLKYIKEIKIGPLVIVLSRTDDKPKLELSENKESVDGVVEKDEETTEQQAELKLRETIEPYIIKIESDDYRVLFEDPDKWLDYRMNTLFETDVNEIYNGTEECIEDVLYLLDDNDDVTALFADKKDEIRALLKELQDSKESNAELLRKSSTDREHYMNFCKWVYLTMKTILKLGGAE